MAEFTGIGWTDHTRNFWEGCTEVGPGCDGCYAKARDVRFHGGKHWGVGAPRLAHLETAARDLRKWNRQAIAAGVRRRVFINSLSDFFDNDAPQEWRDHGYRLMRECQALDFQLVTKRIGNAAKMLPEDWGNGYPNVWLIATIVNQEEANRDLSKLLRIKAAIHGVSYEPALGPIDWAHVRFDDGDPRCSRNALTGSADVYAEGVNGHPDVVVTTEPILPRLDWIIVGGESAQQGHDARQFPISWARSTVDQCRAAGVACFVKQLGSNPLIALEDGFDPAAVARGKWDNPTAWPTGLRVQEFPA